MTHEYDYSSTFPQTTMESMIEKTYDENYFQLRSTTTKDSKGQTTLERIYYSFDFDITVSSGNPPHFTTQLREKNILNVPLLSERWLSNSSGSYLIGSEATEFNVVSGGILRPSAMYSASLAEPLYFSQPEALNPQVFLPVGRDYKSKVTFNNYDEMGRLREYAKEGGITAAIILNESGDVIAKGDNVSSTTFAYAGFESDEQDNWIYDLLGINTTDAIIGTKCYSGSISKTGLLSGNYHVSFFAKGTGVVSVNGVEKAVDEDWKWYRTFIENTTSVNINTNGIPIDEIMVYNEDGNGVSYDYLDGVGMLSATDPNGQVTYYMYDEFNRLKDIKNNAGQIVKSYQYNYQDPFFSSIASESFTKDTCPPGYAPGPPVVYEVPAAKYSSLLSQSDADAQAASDIYFNGQAHANANGICNLVYYNTPISAAFTKNDCPSGTVTFPVYYLVEGAKHSSIISQSDADAKAQTDLTNNGQSYANSNGICRELISVSLSNTTGVLLKVHFSPEVGEFDFVTGSSNLLIPEGTYTVYLNDPTGASHTYYIGQRSSIVGPSATFLSVSIGTGSADNIINASN